MFLSASNILINYFLTHPEIEKITYNQFQRLCKNISQEFQVIISDNSYEQLIQTVQVFSDFMYIDSHKNICQKNILQFLDNLQPVYHYLSFNKWQRQYQYYQYLRQFQIDC